MVICGQDTGAVRSYRGRIEKVKFGVPVAEAFSQDIPPTLLVLLLKVNKEGPSKRDVWRAPGNHQHVRKLTQVMQHGRLVNIANFSVYTAASVIKKFLAKIPGGIFGSDGEERLFRILQLDDAEKQRETFCRVVSGLPVPSQHLLVLLFGTWRLITDACREGETRTGGKSRMSPEAMGISVAPSIFLTCIAEGQRAKIEDVVRFRSASQVLTFVIRQFGASNLFPRDAYEFYARITGRTLRVDENWQFTFQYPARDLVLEREWLRAEAARLHSYSFSRRDWVERLDSGPPLLRIAKSTSLSLSPQPATASDKAAPPQAAASPRRGRHSLSSALLPLNASSETSPRKRNSPPLAKKQPRPGAEMARSVSAKEYELLKASVGSLSHLGAADTTGDWSLSEAAAMADVVRSLSCELF